MRQVHHRLEHAALLGSGLFQQGGAVRALRLHPEQPPAVPPDAGLRVQLELRESTLAIRLLEQLIQAGVEARRALATLSSALALRGEETGGFTTVDLLQLDLFTGEGELYKLGAAPKRPSGPG